MSIQLSEIKPDTYFLECDLSIALQLPAKAFDPNWLQEQSLISHTNKGRGEVFFFDFNSTSLVLRKYLRGGLMSRFNQARFHWVNIQGTRAYKELELLEYMRKKDLPVPTAVAGFVTKDRFFYQAAIITQAIPDAQELHQLLQHKEINTNNWSKIGALIAQMHKLNICHADINVKNILIDNQEKLHLLDFDKCFIRKDGNWKNRNLNRFKRSLDKQKNKFETYHFEQSNWQDLLDGYRGT